MTGIVNNENINTAMTAGSRSRQHSTNSLFAKAADSPSKRSTPYSGGSPRGAPSADLHDHLQAHARSSSPLAPVAGNKRTPLRQSSDVSKLSTPSSLSGLQRAGSKTDGLRLHWDHHVSGTSMSSLHLDSGRTSSEHGSESRHQLAFLSAQDLSIPDLRDSDISPLDSHFLLSPFTMSEPNFGKSPSTQTIQGEKPSPATLPSLANSPAARAQYPVSTATPTSPPRQAFFQTGSTGSFNRFPTPDKLALGFTPLPVQHGEGELPSGLLLPPISPSGPILADNNTLLRSASSQTIQSESSSAGSYNTSSSASGISDIAKSDAAQADEEPPHPIHRASSSRSGRKKGLSRSDIRESLLSFPSPPTSPRPFTFGRAPDNLFPLNNALGSLSSSSRSASTGPSLHGSAIPEEYGSEELQHSIDELLSAAGMGDTKRLPSEPESSRPLTARSMSLPPNQGETSLSSSRGQPSSSLPPNMALPPLPPLSKLSLGQGDSPVTEMPKPETTETTLTASYIRPILPLRAPQTSDAPTFDKASSSVSDAPVGKQHTLITTSSIGAAPARTLRPSKSTESFLAAKSHQMAPAQMPPVPRMDSTAVSDTPKQSRRRRASLSIKIPKMFSKARKQEEDFRPQSAVSQDSLQLPKSRFSPDSDGPTPISEKAPASIFKRLSRAASSPNLKGSASDSVTRQASKRDRFITPASAPPVPATFPAPIQADLSTSTPLPTPSLVTDIDSSMGGDSPGVTGSSENHDSAFARMQTHNPYFPKFPPRQSSLIMSPVGVQELRGPASPHDMDWLTSPPAVQSKASSPLKPLTLQNKAMTALGTSDTRYSDSGSASMSREESNHSRPNAHSARPNGSRRSTLTGSSNGDDEEDEEDAYGGQSLSSDDYYTSSEADDDEDEESEDDDVPLAETHPDALKVQKSLRAKVKGEQSKKKKRTDKEDRNRVKAPRNQERPVQALQPAASSSLPPTSQDKQLGRAVSQGSSLRRPPMEPVVKRNPFGFAPDELSEKLRKLDASHGRLNSLKKPPKRPDSAGERPHDLLLPQTDEHVKHRSNVKGRANLAPPLAPFVQDSVLTMSEGSENEDTAPLRIKKKSQQAPPPTAILTSHPLSRHPAGIASSTPASPRSPTINQHDHSFSALQSETTHHNVVAHHHHHHGRPAFSSRQRVYINDPQHHCTVEVDENMTAASLLAHLRSKNAISSNPAWTVTEVWRAMGVERPLREYELLQESIESWSSEANSSLLLVKKSALAPLLSSLSKPRSEGETPGGWVHLEVKHGKWSKRYIEVRNGAMYIGKSEKQRDQTLLCHFSNFDAYIVPQACILKMKTPKPFAFAVKSVDKVSLFENADQDYIHFFSVKTEAERDMWIQQILESRSKLVKQIAASRAAAQAVDTRSDLVGQQIAQQPPHAVHHTSHYQAGPPVNTSSSVSRSASSNSRSPSMPSQAVFSDASMLARRPSNAQPMLMETKKIISADNLPPLPGAIPSGTFATLPQGRQWERLAPADKRAAIQEASREARHGGKALLTFEDVPEGAGLLGRARAKSVGQRR